MFRKIFAVWIFSMLFFAATAAAAEEYDYICDYAFPVTPVVYCVDDKGEFDHNIYYFSASDKKCLVFICHGYGDNNGYGIHIAGNFRRDYANAIAEDIAYWTQQGKLKNVGKFDYVFMNTCYTGYAPSSVNLPLYNVSLVRAIDYKGITAFAQEKYRDGQILLKLYRVIPKSSRSGRASGALSTFLKKNNVRGFRSIGTRSSTKPEGITILYNPF